MGRVSKYAERKKWAHMLQAFKAALGKVDKAAAAGAPEAAGSKPAKPAKEGKVGTQKAVAEQAAAEAAAGAGGAEKPPKRQKVKKDASPASSAAAEHAEKKVADAAAAAGSSSAGGVNALSEALHHDWRHFAASVAAAERAAAVAEGGFAFAFVEGKLVQAVREGWWLLLDEVNLAPAEVLERIAGLLEGPDGSITLLERGDTQQVRHALVGKRCWLGNLAAVCIQAPQRAAHHNLQAMPEAAVVLASSEGCCTLLLPLCAVA